MSKILRSSSSSLRRYVRSDCVEVQLTVRTVHARNRIRKACRMRNCWNCKNGYSQTQRIGSSRRSRGVNFAIEQCHFYWMSGGAEGDRGRRKQGSTKAGSSHIGILRQITPNKPIMYVYIIQASQASQVQHNKTL
jgi:hypothetical protein